ncbi:extracellular solute-binding protein family 3 [Rippkaea orientalis PCC 8801]|uniref:Extracellular solute-binding protein family 3 n=1 Tax=Rippkaea orientalis (strain PCC 8801 / RF-1) TaxID=41431 RepID=B7K272_RIPO1|nr:transporter substrate-binding domain-containing protein [Rippkaea orientalis]ACK65208.1 extracellular solute-binding protein family 3 [Rippkaea orientalis PCC 8801]
MRKILSSLLISGLIAALISPAWSAELEEILKRGQLIVAVKDNVRPLGFSDQNGELQGLEIDLARRLAEELLGDPQAVIFQPVSNQKRLQMVIDQEVDLAIARVSVTPSRNRLVDFSPYYYLDGTGLVTKQSYLGGVAGLAKGKIAVLRVSSTIAVIRAEFPQAELVGVNSYEEALRLLENETVDAFAGDNSILAGWVQDYPSYRQWPVRLSGEALGVVMPKGLQYASLRDRVNRAIVRWQKSGWLRERAAFWGLP